MNYEINESTLAVIPTNQFKCKIIENQKLYLLNKKSFKIVEHSCEYFGVSYESRLEGSKSFIKSKYKSPIIIEEGSRIIFFPISSPTRNNSYWISFNNILEYYPSKSKPRTTVVKFKNGYRMELPVSFYSFNNQYLRATKLSMFLVERMMKKK